MRFHLAGQAQYCRKRAARCRELRLRDMEQHWLELAESYELAEKISGFLQWNAQRLAPPEAFSYNERVKV
jgi:hypothetical protein